MTALATDNWKAKTFCLNEGAAEERICRLLASTAIPTIFPPVVIDGISYVDGGWGAKGGDNTPIGPILKNHTEINTVIVVFLNDDKQLSSKLQSRVRSAAEKAGVRLIEIIPSKDIDGLLGEQALNMSTERAKELINLGRKDARKALGEAGLFKTVSSKE